MGSGPKGPWVGQEWVIVCAAAARAAGGAGGWRWTMTGHVGGQGAERSGGRGARVARAGGGEAGGGFDGVGVGLASCRPARLGTASRQQHQSAGKGAEQGSAVQVAPRSTAGPAGPERSSRG